MDSDRGSQFDPTAFDTMLKNNRLTGWMSRVGACADIDQVTDEALAGPVRVHGSWSVAAFGLPAATALPAYRAARPAGTPGDLLADVLTDWWVRVPAGRLADAHASSPGVTFMYEFSWPSPAFGGRSGACHGLELAFVFDNLDRGREQMLGGALGDAPPQQPAATVHAAWVGFASVGDPGWPRYDLGRRLVMRLGVPCSVVEDPCPGTRVVGRGALNAVPSGPGAVRRGLMSRWRRIPGAPAARSSTSAGAWVRARRLASSTPAPRAAAGARTGAAPASTR